MRDKPLAIKASPEPSPSDRGSASRSGFEWGRALRVIDPRSERFMVAVQCRKEQGLSLERSRAWRRAGPV
jgi:hypothetical protein